jgi:adenylylsulfate kinase
MNQNRAKQNHLKFYNGYVARIDRHRLNKHRSGVVWFTGLPGSGKSTLAHHLERELFNHGVRAYVLDGDNVRHGLNADLGFTRDDRKENIRRIVEVSKLLVDAGIIVLSAFISPYKEDRALARQAFGQDNFLEIYVKCPLEECEKRDPKGQYRKARRGIIGEYTGITAPYEEPDLPDLVVDTLALNLEEALELILRRLNQAGLGWQPVTEA